jgi:hypothetical protein
MRKYGKKNFSITTLLACTEPLLDTAEQRFVKDYDSFIDDGFGYNLTRGGYAVKSFSKLTRRKMAAAKTGKSQTEVHRLASSKAQLKSYQENPSRRLKQGENSRRAWDACTPRRRRERVRAVCQGHIEKGGSAKISDSLKKWYAIPAHLEELKRKRRITSERPEVHEAWCIAQRKRRSNPADCQKTGDASKAMWAKPGFREKWYASKGYTFKKGL